MKHYMIGANSNFIGQYQAPSLEDAIEQLKKDLAPDEVKIDFAISSGSPMDAPIH